MAISISDLIAKKEQVEASKKALYDIETSIGVITTRKPTQSIVAEALDLEDGGDEYLILNMTVEPDLKDTQLQKAYGCIEPTDIISKLFDPGEIRAIGQAILKTAGFKQDGLKVKLHETVKN